MAIDNLFALEPEIVARLKAALADRPDVHVLSAIDLAAVTEEKQLLPAVHVLHRGFAVSTVAGASRADGRAQVLDQEWVVVVATSAKRDLKRGTDGRVQAGQLAVRALMALMGYRCPSAAGPLRLVPGPGGSIENGFQYLPLSFQTMVAVTAPAN